MLFALAGLHFGVPQRASTHLTAKDGGTYSGSFTLRGDPVDLRYGALTPEAARGCQRIGLTRKHAMQVRWALGRRALCLLAVHARCLTM